MKRLNVWELIKGVCVAAAGLGLAVALLAYLGGYGQQALQAGLWCVAGVLLIAGMGGVGYTLAQLSVGSELMGAQFGLTVGSFLGSYQEARARARGQVPPELAAAVKDTLPEAAPIGQAVRDTGGPDGAVVVSRFKLDWVLTQMVIRQHEGKRISRGALLRENVCDGRYWNLANASLIALGLRVANSTEWVSRGSQALDLAAVVKGVKVVAREAVWVLSGTPATWQKLDLHAVHFLNSVSSPEEAEHVSVASDPVVGRHVAGAILVSRGSSGAT